MSLLRTGMLLATVGTSAALAGALPPSSSKPLSEVLASLVTQGYTSPTDLEFGDGQWQIELLHGDKPVEVYVDPRSGKIVSELRDGLHANLPADVKPLDEIVRDLEGAGYLAISEIDFEGGHWEIDTSRNGVRCEVLIDIRTGKVLSERIKHG